MNSIKYLIEKVKNKSKLIGKKCKRKKSKKIGKN